MWLPVTRCGFFSTTMRQRGNPCTGKVQIHQEQRKQDKASQNSKQCKLFSLILSV